MINEDRGNFQYKGGDLVYMISSLTIQLHTASCKVAIKYVGPVVVDKIIDPCFVWLCGPSFLLTICLGLNCT